MSGPNPPGPDSEDQPAAPETGETDTYSQAYSAPVSLFALTGLLFELLSKTEMRHYFPDCTTLLSESFLGLVKSLIAVKAA